jgi:hypothetical protein
VARNIFSTIPHGVGVEASFSLGRDLISSRQSKATGETDWEKVDVGQVAPANHGILESDSAALDAAETKNISELKKEMEEGKMHRMPKAHNFLEMWQCSQNLCATQKESDTQNKQMIAVGYISDSEEIIKASWSHFPHHGVAGFQFLERSPLPPAWSAKDHIS